MCQSHTLRLMRAVSELLVSYIFVQIDNIDTTLTNGWEQENNVNFLILIVSGVGHIEQYVYNS